MEGASGGCGISRIIITVKIYSTQLQVNQAEEEVGGLCE